MPIPPLPRFQAEHLNFLLRDSIDVYQTGKGGFVSPPSALCRYAKWGYVDIKTLKTSIHWIAVGRSDELDLVDRRCVPEVII